MIYNNIEKLCELGSNLRRPHEHHDTTYYKGNNREKGGNEISNDLDQTRTCIVHMSIMAQHSRTHVLSAR